MFNFDLKEAAIYRAVIWERSPVFRFTGFFKKLFFFLFVFVFLIFLAGFFSDIFDKNNISFLFDLSVFSLTLALFNWLAETFLNTKLKKPFLPKDGEGENFEGEPERHNLAEFLGFEAAKAGAEYHYFFLFRWHIINLT